jgi:hypothetical protein
MLPPSHRTGRQLYTLSFRHTEFSEIQHGPGPIAPAPTGAAPLHRTGALERLLPHPQTLSPPAKCLPQGFPF